MLEMEERKEEHKCSELKEEEDRRLQEKELMLKEQEIERQRLKDREEKSRRESLTGLTKHHGEALKHVLPRIGHESSDYPSFCVAVENLFALYQVPKQIQSKLLFRCLTSVVKHC